MDKRKIKEDEEYQEAVEQIPRGFFPLLCHFNTWMFTDVASLVEGMKIMADSCTHGHADWGLLTMKKISSCQKYQVRVSVIALDNKWRCLIPRRQSLIDSMVSC